VLSRHDARDLTLLPRRARGRREPGRTDGEAIVISVLGALLLLASSCAESPSSAKLPTLSSAASPLPAASPPPGGPVPAQLLGDWFLPPSVVKDFDGNAVCVLLKLTLTATTYQITHTALGACGTGGSGDVVVNGSEIDFFNGSAAGCVDTGGRYTWTLTSELLYFTLISDPCRPALRLQHGWSRTS
jgi:hypothetical protein